MVAAAGGAKRRCSYPWATMTVEPIGRFLIPDEAHCGKKEDWSFPTSRGIRMSGCAALIRAINLLISFRVIGTNSRPTMLPPEAWVIAFTQSEVRWPKL